MKLLVGLGNPGAQYSKTRHNIGFMLIENIVGKLHMEKKFNCLYGNIGNILFAMPQTYMNRSGDAVQQIMNFYKISINDLIVVHDDIDLELGRIKVKIGGGNGGHNGLKSIDQNVGINYLRIRLGVGRPQYCDVASYVLQNFRQEELSIVDKMLGFISANLGDLTKDNLSQNEINIFLNKYQ